ncbi:MAG: hypothetical protein R3F20_15015 [Planctomycetota bacterium]
MSRLVLASALAAAVLVASPGLRAQGATPDPIQFPPSAVPASSPLDYSGCWVATSYLLQLHWAPDWPLGRDVLGNQLFVPVPTDPNYNAEQDWVATLQSLHMARSMEFSCQYLLARMQDTVLGGPLALAPGTFGRLRGYNSLDILFHVGPDWTPPGETTPRPFLSLVVPDPFDAYEYVGSIIGHYPTNLARWEPTALAALMNFVRANGAAVMTVSHQHADSWHHPLFLDGLFAAGAATRFGAGQEPTLLLPDEIMFFLATHFPLSILSPGVQHFTEAQPFVVPVAGTTESFRVDRVSTYQDMNFDGVYQPQANGPYTLFGIGGGPLAATATPFAVGPDVQHTSLKIRFPGGPEVAIMGEGTFVDLPAFQTYFPSPPDYVFGTGNHTSPVVWDWIVDTAGGGANGATYVPTGYHNFHPAAGWVPFPGDHPLTALPGFVQFITGG